MTAFVNQDILALEVMTGGFVTGNVDPDPNLINGDFETNNTGWFYVGTGAQAPSTERVTTVAHTGTYSQRINVDLRTGLGTAGFPVIAGKTYRLQGWEYTTTAGGVCHFYIEFYDSEGVYIGQSADDTRAVGTDLADQQLTVNTWFEHNVFAKAPAYAKYGTVRIVRPTDGYTRYIDSISVTQLTVGSNLFPTGNMENGIAEWSQPVVTGNPPEVGTTVHAGTKSLLIHGNAIHTGPKFTVTAGKTYFTTAWTKSPSNLTRIGIRWYNSSNALISTGLGLYHSGSNLWEVMSFGGVAPAGAVKAGIYIEAGGVSTDEYIDDVDFYEVITVVPVSTPSNLLRNPDGAKGAWGWQSPAANTNITSGKDANGPYLKAQDLSTAVGSIAYVSELVKVTQGKYVGLRYDVVSVSNAAVKVRARINWYDASSVLVSSTAYNTEGGVGTGRLGSFAVPANAVYAAIEFAQVRTGGADPVQNDYFVWRNAMLAEGTSAQVNTTMSYAPYGVWTNIITDSTEIKVSRKTLDVGLLSATVRNANLDPSVTDTLRPGRPVRLRVLTAGVWESLYEGALTNANVDYAANGRIDITASDNIAVLANRGESRGVAAVASLPYILEGAGVPWNINGAGNQVTTATIVSKNANASLLDQIAITRDTNLAYAWVDRTNVLKVYNQANLSTTSIIEFVDTPNDWTSLQNSYSAIETNFNTQSIINDVTVKFLRYNGKDTEEITYGPYRDQTSINTWGSYAATFTIQGATEVKANIDAYANSILFANATPEVRVNSLTMPVRQTRDLPHSLVDLYDRVSITLGSKVGVRQRVVGIQHNIRPGHWTVDLDFEAQTSVAAPTWTPSPPAPELPVDTGWITSASGWTQDPDWSIQFLNFRKQGSMMTINSTVQYLNATTITSTSAGNIADQLLFTVPTAYRPWTRTTGSYEVGGVAGGTVRLETNGNVYLTNLSPNAVIAQNNTLWFTLFYMLP